jgi:hypothetical protein
MNGTNSSKTWRTSRAAVMDRCALHLNRSSIAHCCHIFAHQDFGMMSVIEVVE